MTLTEIPAAMESSIAPRLSFVAGILTSRFGRSTISHRSFARVIVPSVSKASSGETSRDTYPSLCSVCS